MDRKERKYVRMDKIQFGLDPSAALVCHSLTSLVEDNVLSGRTKPSEMAGKQNTACDLRQKRGL